MDVENIFIKMSDRLTEGSCAWYGQNLRGQYDVFMEYIRSSCFGERNFTYEVLGAFMPFSLPATINLSKGVTWPSTLNKYYTKISDTEYSLKKETPINLYSTETGTLPQKLYEAGARVLLANYDYLIGNGWENPVPDGRKKSIPFCCVVGEANNGQIGIRDFMSIFFGKLGDKSGILDRIERPLFAIIDHNSAHHMAYILAQKAFSLAPREDQKKIVISFDNHDDAGGGPVSTLIDCRNWVCAAVTPMQIAVNENDKQRNFPAVDGVVVIGVKGGKGNTWVVHRDENGTIQKNKITALTVNGANLNDVLNEALFTLGIGERAGIDFYVTVDRDFMTGSFTPYGDGFYSPAVGRSAVQNCLDYFQGRRAQLTGFDVIGLPTEGGRSTAIRFQKDAASQAVEDIRIFYNAVIKYQ